jgi:hypothetical protein
MLEIHPLTDEQELNAYISEKGLPEDSAVLRAYENGEVTGNISLTLETQPNEEGAMRAFLMIGAFEYPDDFTCELMLRAAASFAFNRMIPEVRALSSMKNPIFERMGFKDDGKVLTIATQNVVHFCK